LLTLDGAGARVVPLRPGSWDVAVVVRRFGRCVLLAAPVLSRQRLAVDVGVARTTHRRGRRGRRRVRVDACYVVLDRFWWAIFRHDGAVVVA